MKLTPIHYLLLICAITFTTKSVGQVKIEMQEKDGVYIAPCKVNGLKLNFIFDTGASDVSISLTEALFMIKNGYLIESDIQGSTYYSLANGDIVENTSINIRELEIGGKTLQNIKASITHNIEAPLLLGQSVINKLGRIELVDNTLILLDEKPQIEIDEAAIQFEQACEYLYEIRSAPDDKSKKGFELCYKAAHSGNAEAQCLLADIYSNGNLFHTGVKKNLSEAFFWYQQSANQEYASAQWQLANCYKNGEGILKSPKEALSWYIKAANNGSPNAMFDLGKVFYFGEGTEKNNELAAYWIWLAYENNIMYRDEIYKFWNENELWKYQKK